MLKPTHTHAEFIPKKSLFFYFLIFNLYLILSFFIGTKLNAQNIGINGSGAVAHPSALLDVDAASTPSLGILIPRIALQAINVAAPVTSPATSLLVYNTVSASTGTNAVSTGYYYWDGTKWVRFAYNASGSFGDAWTTLGNAGTTAGINFLGTTDNQDLVFKRNGVQAGLLNNSLQNTSFGVNALNPVTSGLGGNVAIGTNVLRVNTTGFTSTGVGQNALFSQTTAFENTAIGNGSMFNTTTGSQNTAVGRASLSNNTIGIRNSAIGNQALLSNINGNDNSANGMEALRNNTSGNFNTAVGSGASYSVTTGNNNSSVGAQAMYNTTTGENNVAIGKDALYANLIGNYNTALGAEALRSSTTINEATAVGGKALRNNTTGIVNTAVGGEALMNNTTGSSNTGIGHSSLRVNINGNRNSGLGYLSLPSNTTGSDNTAIGFQALRSNITSNNNTAVGSSALAYNISGANNTALGAQASFSNTTGNENVAVGANALNYNTNGSSNVAVGYNSLFSSPAATFSNNTAVGWNSLANNTANFNTAVGAQALRFNTTGGFNTALGTNALAVNSTGHTNTALGFQSLLSNNTGYENTAAGFASLSANTTGFRNTAFGRSALESNRGNLNTAIGWYAGITNTVGVNNTFVGASADVTADTYTNATAIGYNAKVGQSNALILGGTGTDAVNVGIGTSTPYSKLDIHENTGTSEVRITSGTPVKYGELIFSSNNSAFLNRGASIEGNGEGVGIDVGALIFKTQYGIAPRTEQMRINSIGNVGIGTTTPGDKISVNGRGEFVTTIADHGVRVKGDPTNAQSIYQFTNHLGTIQWANIMATPNGGGDLTFSTQFSPKMIITSAGNVGIGTLVPSSQFHVVGTSYVAGKSISERAGVANPMFEARKTDAGAGSMMTFLTNGSITGEITTSGVSTAYNTTSDIRLKENIKESAKGINDVMKIAVKDYNYKADETKMIETGFIAQELYEIYPQAVRKGGEDAKTNPWMIDYSKLTPLLIKGMQEQQAQLKLQEAKIEKLEKQNTEILELLKKK